MFTKSNHARLVLTVAPDKTQAHRQADRHVSVWMSGVTRYHSNIIKYLWTSLGIMEANDDSYPDIYFTYIRGLYYAIRWSCDRVRSHLSLVCLSDKTLHSEQFVKRSSRVEDFKAWFFSFSRSVFTSQSQSCSQPLPGWNHPTMDPLSCPLDNCGRKQASVFSPWDEVAPSCCLLTFLHSELRLQTCQHANNIYCLTHAL